MDPRPETQGNRSMNMETLNETRRMDLVHRAVAFIAASVAVVFTGNTHLIGNALVHVALAPFRAVFGG
jgi:hypothetical protein